MIDWQQQCDMNCKTQEFRNKVAQYMEKKISSSQYHAQYAYGKELLELQERKCFWGH